MELQESSIESVFFFFADQIFDFIGHGAYNFYIWKKELQYIFDRLISTL